MEIRFSERHIIALNFILVAILAYVAARTVNDAIAIRLMRPPVAPAASRSSGEASPAVRQRSYYQAIIDRDIFNLVPQAPVAAAPVVVEDLHLTLLGISQTSIGRPFVVIEDRSGQQALYRVGDFIPNAGKLVAVDAHRAIIEHQGRSVALELPKDELPGPVVAPPEEVAPPPEVDSPENLPDAPPADPAVSNLGGNRYRVPRVTLDRSLSNLSQLFTQIRAIPNLVNGHANGFALSEIQPGSVFEQMGLEDGDVLQSVDGQRIRDPMQAMQMLGSLHDQNAVQLTVLRAGRQVSLNYEIR